MKHTISILVENHAGVLARISGLFARRGYNIHSLAVGVTEDETVSRITITAEGTEYTLEQIVKQLNKLIDVIKVRTVSTDELIERELMLVKISCTASQRAEVTAIASITKARIVDIFMEGVTLELSDTAAAIATLLELLKPYGIKEIVRTGMTAIQKGNARL